MRRLAIGAAAMVVLGCQTQLPPPGHILVHVDTDAPLAVPVGESPPGLFDRLLVEVYPPGATTPCPDCSRQTDATRGLFQSGVSFSVRGDTGESGVRIKVRLFASNPVSQVTLHDDQAITTYALLPDLPAEGALDVAIFLPTDDAGFPNGSLDDPVSPLPYVAGPSRTGTWSGATRVDCQGAARPDEVCVPGGAFWMGSPFLTATEGDIRPKDRRRIVRMSPYFLDAHEVTVAEFRAAGIDGATPWNGSRAGTKLYDWCTFTTDGGAPGWQTDGYPINCLGTLAAQAYCQKLGKDLPTTAQLEYAAGALESRTYPWGLDTPDCNDAVSSRAGFGIFATGPGYCRAADDPGGPLPLVTDGSVRASADRVTLPGGTIYDLVGNMTEWTRDVYNDEDEPCWVHPGTEIFTDPTCSQPGRNGAQQAAYGGCWALNGIEMVAAFNSPWDPTKPVPIIGFRCARPASAP
jgi:formylglycine-generating enzyme required for sulfatase activity